MVKLKDQVQKKSRKETRDYIAGLVKSGAVKTALSWITKKWAFFATGPLGWLAALVLDQVWDYFGDKIVRYGMRKGALIYDKVDGHIKVIKIKEAKKDGKQADYDNSIDDAFK